MHAQNALVYTDVAAAGIVPPDTPFLYATLCSEFHFQRKPLVGSSTSRPHQSLTAKDTCEAEGLPNCFLRPFAIKSNNGDAPPGFLALMLRQVDIYINRGWGHGTRASCPNT